MIEIDQFDRTILALKRANPAADELETVVAIDLRQASMFAAGRKQDYRFIGLPIDSKLVE